MLNYSIQKLGTHPIIIERTDALLCSINDRLGGGTGQNIGPLDIGLLVDDCLGLLQFENKTAEDAIAEAEKQSRSKE